MEDRSRGVELACAPVSDVNGLQPSPQPSQDMEGRAELSEDNSRRSWPRAPASAGRVMPFSPRCFSSSVVFLLLRMPTTLLVIRMAGMVGMAHVRCLRLWVKLV